MRTTEKGTTTATAGLAKPMKKRAPAKPTRLEHLTRDNVWLLAGPANASESQVEELRQQVAAAKEERERLEAEKKALAEAEAAQQREEERARAAKAERQKGLNEEAAALGAELVAANAVIAKNVDRGKLDHPLLYIPNDEVDNLVKSDGRRKEFLEYIQSLDAVDEVAREAEQFAYAWVQKAKSENPFDTVFGICYEGYTGGYGGCSIYIGINGRGKKVFEDTTDNWVKLADEHRELGYIWL